MTSPCPACRSDDTLAIAHGDLDAEAISAVDGGRATVPTLPRPDHLFWECRCARCGFEFSPTSCVPRVSDPLEAAIAALDAGRLAQAAHRTHGHLDPLGRVFLVRSVHRASVIPRRPDVLRRGRWVIEMVDVDPTTPVRLHDTVLVVDESDLHPPARVLDLGEEDRRLGCLGVVVLRDATAETIPLASLSPSMLAALEREVDGGAPVGVDVATWLLPLR